MSTRGRLLAIAALTLASLAARADTVAIVQARAWTLTTDTALENATIVITDGKIVAVTAGGAAPAGARVIDAQGRPVTPAMLHPASQLGLVEVGAASETVDHTVKPGSQGVPAAGFDVRYAINPSSTLIQLARADGVTRAVSRPAGSGAQPFAGSGVMLHLTEQGEIVERTQIGVFASINNRSATATVGSRAAQWQALRTALERAQDDDGPPREKERGRRAEADTVVLRQVLERQIPLVIATERASDLRQAVSVAKDYGIRLIVLGGAEGWLVADELAAANVAVVLDPTVNLPRSFDELGARLDNAALLRKAGVMVAVAIGGVQAYNVGTSLREGAGLAVANGLPYVEGLRAIMSAPARIWGVGDRHGTIAPGLDADLVLWDGDPLEPSTAPVTVLLRGREVSLVTRQTLLRDRYLPQLPAR